MTSEFISTPPMKTRSIKIPEDVNWMRICIGTWSTDVPGKFYEIWCSEEDLTGNVYTNENLPF